MLGSTNAPSAKQHRIKMLLWKTLAATNNFWSYTDFSKIHFHQKWLSCATPESSILPTLPKFASEPFNFLKKIDLAIVQKSRLLCQDFFGGA